MSFVTFNKQTVDVVEQLLSVSGHDVVPRKTINFIYHVILLELNKGLDVVPLAAPLEVPVVEGSIDSSIEEEYEEEYEEEADVEPVAVVDPVILPEICPKVTKFHLSRIKCWSQWRDWCNVDKLAYRRARLSFALKHFGMDTDTGKEIIALKRGIVKKVARGDVRPVERVEKHDIWDVRIRKTLEDAELKVNDYNLFSVFLPPRRPSDMCRFYVIDDDSDRSAILGTNINELNYFVKRDKTFHFNKYKNSDAYGAQVFDVEFIKTIWYADRVDKGVAYLMEIEDCTKLCGSTFKAYTTSADFNTSMGVPTNAYRHYAETVVSPVLGTVKQQKRLSWWLCHTTVTAQDFYNDN